MKKSLLTFGLLVLTLPSFAQRFTDNLDRGLVAVNLSSGVFLSWRVQADEYYDVTYNLYRDGSLIATNLQVSNYTDSGGSQSSAYQVAAVRNGVVQEKCSAPTVQTQQYFQFPVSDVQNRSGVTVWSQSDPSSASANYTINDISLGDIDGDGKVDFIVKRKNQTDQDNLFPTDNLEMFCQIEAYASSINYGRLWWIDCGPNICYGADEQWDAVAFDWNEDGACEVLYRGGANTVLHHSDGTTTTIGSTSENIRSGITHTANMTFSNSGEEWLMYIDGKTGKAFDYITYPLPRGNASDWGDSYGHRSSKYFTGAPYLDGQNPYIFLGRGIYTKIDACTYRVNKATNKLYQVGETWHSYTNTGWYGQGYHNFAVADVDLDGRDEIVYGSMVLDFHSGTGRLHGMSSTGLGHGDASHTGDLDPYRKGLETFACNEENPGYNYRNAATCEIYARGTATSDDGRAMAANVSNDYPGSFGASASSGILPLSYVQPDPYSPVYIEGITNNLNVNTPSPMALNFRIYWDGDLQEETINGPGSSEAYLYIDKMGSRIYDTGHGNYETTCINGTKKNPCASGDIWGDWREELVMRSDDNCYIRVYTTVTPTTYRIPSLWYDHQYRQGMVWQTEGYNQPAHLSYFLGELENLTQAPPPFTTRGRTVIADNQSITSDCNGKEVLVATYGDGATSTVTMQAGATPSSIFLYAPTTIEGGDQVQYNETKHTFDRIYVTGGAFTGSTNIAKQGDAALHLPTQQHTHTGRTDVWQGALICYGSMANSPLWANLHTELFLGADLSASPTQFKSIEMEYGSALYLSNPSFATPYTNNNGYAHLSTSQLTLKEGARIVFDIQGDGNASGDCINVTGSLSVRKRSWSYGPTYSAPVFEIRSNSALANGRYKLGTVAAVGSGSIDNIVIECANTSARYIYLERTANGELDLVLSDLSPTNKELLENNALENGTTGWTFAATGGDWSAVENSDPHVIEAYAGWSALEITDFQMSQTVSLEPGQYKLTGYGFYRYGDAYNTDASASRAEMFAGSASVPVVTLGSITQSSYANNRAGASAAFADGLYLNELSFDVAETSTVEIGFRGTHDLMKSWFIAGPMSLVKVANVSTATATYPEVFCLDFEEESSNNYGFTGNGTFSQYTKADGTHCFHADQNSGSGDRTANLNLSSLSTEFALATDYVFEFDWGHSVSNENDSRTTLQCDDNATLFYINTPKFGTSTLCDASGNTIATLTNDGYAKACPTKLSHFKVTSNSNGTYLTVTYDTATVVNNYALADGLKHITALDTYLGRVVSHLAIDNMTLTSRKLIATLCDTKKPLLESGLYGTLTIERNLKAGINSFCVPFQTTPEAIAGTGAKAWTFDEVQDMGNGTDRFYFAQSETIEPNVPYLLEVPAAVSVPSFSNITVTAPAAGYVEKSGWRFVCNYVPEMVLSEQNYVVKNGYLMQCANGALTNGMRAYFVAPSDAESSGSRTIYVCFDEEMESGIESTDVKETSAEAIFDVSGQQQLKLRQGINIVRSGNGSVHKIIIK